MVNELFVFGSNTQGRHGRGAALHARQHYGAIYGVPMGHQGNSYAIITKELRAGHKPISLDFIIAQINTFHAWLRWTSHGYDLIHITRIGCGLAGFTDEQIAPHFRWATSQHEIVPDEWRALWK